MRFPIIAAGALLAAATSAQASFTTVDLSSYVNGNVAINAATYPTGLSMGNKGTNVPFFIAQYPAASGVEGTWLSDALPGDSVTVDLTGMNISGQASFYALLNNYYGTPGADEYDVTITATNNDSVTYQSIGGVDTRDYNSNVFTNTIANTTTEWFNNGIGQRFDVREFTLPASFATETIASFTVTQVTDGDNALLSGLTFSDQPAQNFVPEPFSLSLFGAGLAGIAIRRRRRKAS
ncbi:MAG TPA: PEP-CTERM sorting domain-containing protein [Rhizomicrobium sp.]|nr:PEP-CTERM sorting domain-containing protein [Rhizomicrobium sp.]